MVAVYKENLYALLNAYIEDKNLMRALQILKTEKLKDSKDVKLEQLELKISKENFRINYFGSRIAVLKEGNKSIAEYEWNGNVKGCIKGEIPDYIQEKIENRINYFRVSAGVPAVYLDTQLNNWCQKAALVMESNNKLHHRPTKIWNCYTEEAAEAAKYSLLTQNATNTLAITSFMADQTNPTLGNRRWMLYPFSLVWGHGSTKTKCVLWALDDSRTKDTLYYKANFIAWPYHGYVNKMFLFKKWSFSMMDDLAEAQITMLYNKKPLKLKVELLSEGYGLPTLVWTPEMDWKTAKEGDKIEVTVKLKGNKTYYYTVKVFDYNPE